VRIGPLPVSGESAVKHQVAVRYGQDGGVAQPVVGAPYRVSQTSKVKHAPILSVGLIVQLFKRKRRAQPRPEAGARQERTLAAVAWTPMFGV
jgi:hypothetical protein